MRSGTRLIKAARLVEVCLGLRRRRRSLAAVSGNKERLLGESTATSQKGPGRPFWGSCI